MPEPLHDASRPEAQQLAIYIGWKRTANGAALLPERSSCCPPCLFCWR